MTAAAARLLPRQVTRWAAGHRLSAAALTGTGLACGCCAAVWFSAGTPAGTLLGGVLLTAGCLVQAAAGRTAATGPARAEPARAEPAPAVLQAANGWLAAGCAVAAESAGYAGLALGAPAGQQHRVWPLAVAAAILLAFRQTALVCHGGHPGPGPGPGAGQPRPGARLAGPQQAEAGRRGAVAAGAARLGWQLLTLPAVARAVLLTVAALAGGPWLALAVLLAWGAVGAAASMARWRTPAGPAALPDCRGDGPIARRAGWIAHGQLTPLPPALVGLAATSLLAVLGLRGLSGVVMLAPPAVMLLAAPGAGHPHDGRLDWLVPPALQAGQYIYLAALGFAAGVPGWLTFTLVAVIALRQLDAACRARHPLGPRPRYAGAGLGWEGRMLACGIAAAAGAATFAYLVLTAYLGVLLGWICLSSWYSVREEVYG